MASDAELELVDLLNDVDGLASLLSGQLARAKAAEHSAQAQAPHVLDAFLIAAGMCQVVEDYLHRRPYVFEAAYRRLSHPKLAAGRRALNWAAYGTTQACQLLDRPVARWHFLLRQVVGGLASAAMDEGAKHRLDDVHEKAGRLLASLPALPESLRHEILRLPDSFRAFDQQPDDCLRLAAKFAERWPDRAAPLLVVGVRTSGNYLAPVMAVALKGLGYHEVDWLTYRPGQPDLRLEQAYFRRLSQRGGTVLVIDDPPVTGNKLARTAEALRGVGIPVVLLVPLLGEDGSLPAPLRPWDVVTLPWADWAFHLRFKSEALMSTFADLLEGGTIAAVTGVERIDLARIGELGARPLTRSHMRRVYRVDVTTTAGMRSSLDVYVKGTGLGYLGRHSMAIARRVTGSVPEVYGWRDGFLFRRALPEEMRLTAVGLDSNAAVAIADYVARRAGSVPAGEDKSLRLRRRHPVWELAADVLSEGFGPAAPLAGPIMRRAAIKMLACPAPSVVDGSTSLAHWFQGGDPASLVKVDFDERAFSVWDRYCYDAVWDLAGAAADHTMSLAIGGGDEDFSALLRAEYEYRTDDRISPERWFLYRTVHLLAARRHFVRVLQQGVGQLQTHGGSPPPRPDVTEPGFRSQAVMSIWACDEAAARVLGQYHAEVLLTGKGVTPAGPACSVALGAALGSPTPGGAVLNRSGAMAIRALLSHGFRPLVITDGSLRRLQQQAGDYGAAGGIGEHATVSYDCRPARSSMGPAKAGDLSGLHGWTTINTELESIVAPPGFANTVRLLEPDQTGRLRAPGSLVAPAGATLVAGPHHVDLVPAGHREATASLDLLGELAGDERVYQASCLADVAAVLGHLPGACPECRAPKLSPASELVLGALDGPGCGRMAGVVRLLGVVARSFPLQ